MIFLALIESVLSAALARPPSGQVVGEDGFYRVLPGMTTLLRVPDLVGYRTVEASCQIIRPDIKHIGYTLDDATHAFQFHFWMEKIVDKPWNWCHCELVDTDDRKREYCDPAPAKALNNPLDSFLGDMTDSEGKCTLFVSPNYFLGGLETSFYWTSRGQSCYTAKTNALPEPDTRFHI